MGTACYVCESALRDYRVIKIFCVTKGMRTPTKDLIKSEQKDTANINESSETSENFE